MVHVCTLSYIANSSSFFKRYGSTSKSSTLLVFGGRTLILTVQKAVGRSKQIGMKFGQDTVSTLMHVFKPKKSFLMRCD